MLQSTPKELETPIFVTFRIKMLSNFTQPLTFRSNDMCDIKGVENLHTIQKSKVNTLSELKPIYSLGRHEMQTFLNSELLSLDFQQLSATLVTFLFMESFFTIVCKIVRHLKDVIKYRGEAIFSDLPLP